MKAALILPLLLAVLPACASAASTAGSSSGLPWVELAGQRYEVELATDDHSRAQGLMYRTQLPAGRGMLFIHDRQEWQAYWMKNTRIPLDILYFDNQLRLVSQQRNVPPCPPRSDCPPYPSEGPARYVLELNAGHAARLQLQNGQRLILGPGIPRPTDLLMMLSLPDWRTLADTDDEQWPLLAAVLRVAADEHPQLDAQACHAQLQGHADALATEVASIASLPLKMAAINRHLFQEQGYGPAEDYYAADNNHLHHVLAQRRGNPIALAIVQIEVANRLGLPVHGISFPGHFLTALDLGDDAILAMDPYHGGNPLGLEQIEALAAQHLGGQAPEAELLVRLLMPTPVRGIVLRLLRNLQRSWSLAGQWDKVARCADRQLLLAPENAEARRDRGLAYLQLGHTAAARRDLERYLRQEPQASDSQQISDLLRDAPISSGRLH